MSILFRVTFLLVSIASFIPLASSAQKFTVTTSEPVTFTPHSQVIRYGNQYISMEQSDPILHTSFKFNLHKYKFHYKLYQQDKSMQLVKEVKLNNGDRVYGPFSSILKKIHQKLYFVYFNIDVDTDEGPIHLMAAEVDTVSLGLLPPTELITIDFKDSKSRFTWGNIDLYDKLYIEQSPDHAHTLVSWSSGIDNLYFYSVLDAGLKPVWSKKGSIESVDKIRLEGSCIDNKAKVYVALKGLLKDDLENGHVVFGSQKGADKDVVINITDAKASGINLVVAANEDMVKVTGTYKTGKSPTLFGVYYTSIKGGDTRFGKIQTTPFTDELLKELKHDEWSNLKEKYLGVYDKINMAAYEHKNGNIDMVGMFRGRNFIGTNSTIVTGDILCTHFSNGKATFSRIPKFRQSAGSTIGDSYSWLVRNNETIIFYNDNEKNLLKDLKDDASNSNVYKDVVLVAATIADGQVAKREKVIDLKDDNYMAVPDWMVPTATEKLLVPILKVKGLGGIGKESRFAIISLQ